MKAPEYQRVDLLGVAITRGTDELRAPIDRIEVVERGARVNCWAGSRQVSFAVAYAQGGQYEVEGRDGAPAVGPVCADARERLLEGHRHRSPAAAGRDRAGVISAPCLVILEWPANAGAPA